MDNPPPFTRTQPPPGRKTTRLRQIVRSPELEFLLEAHSGLAAKVVEEAGFAGIWASGFSIAAQMGLPDNNTASWSEVLQVAEYMAEGARIPVLLDGDTGYGNFNNVRRLVR